jgi:hypothetical protein
LRSLTAFCGGEVRRPPGATPCCSGKIREVLAASPFYGEGHRKVWARLRFQEVRTSKARVLRLMREAQLLAPSRTLPKPENPHTGTIITARPNEVWASDHTLTVTVEQGQVIRGAGTAAASSTRLLRRLPRRRGCGHPQPARPRQPVHERRLPSRNRLFGHGIFAVVRATARM